MKMWEPLKTIRSPGTVRNNLGIIILVEWNIQESGDYIIKHFYNIYLNYMEGYHHQSSFLSLLLDRSVAEQGPFL